MAIMGDQGCLFCDIIAGKVEASVVHEDDHVVAFMDLYPVTPGHVLIVPRAHAVGLEDLPEKDGMYVWRMGHRIGRALRQTSLRWEGFNVFLADGEAAGQEIFHVHLHVFPRYRDDGFHLTTNQAIRARPLLDEEAAQIRDALV